MPPSAWDSVACVNVLLLFAVGSLGFSLQEKKQADRVASRKGPVLRLNLCRVSLPSAPSGKHWLPRPTWETPRLASRLCGWAPSTMIDQDGSCRAHSGNLC